MIEHFKDFNLLQTWQRKRLSDVTHTPFTTLKQKLHVLQKCVYCCETTKPITFFLINFGWFILPSSTVRTRKHSSSMRTTRFCSQGVGFTPLISYLLATPQIPYCLHLPTPTPVTEWLTFPQLLLRVVTIEHILPKKTDPPQHFAKFRQSKHTPVLLIAHNHKNKKNPIYRLHLLSVPSSNNCLT